MVCVKYKLGWPWAGGDVQAWSACPCGQADSYSGILSTGMYLWAILLISRSCFNSIFWSAIVIINSEILCRARLSSSVAFASCCCKLATVVAGVLSHGVSANLERSVHYSLLGSGVAASDSDSNICSPSVTKSSCMKVRFMVRFGLIILRCSIHLRVNKSS